LQSYTEVIDAKLRYPNTALLYIEFDSSQFNGSVPQISCEPRGRVIRVPDTYDPETRTYSGTWAGAFKWAWTDNPGWIFYDLVVTDRFGLGDSLTAANIDKWMLYQVAQYCDQLVPDGKGGDGMEPRYTCNVYVQDRNDAYTVLRDFAAIFRGMTYWGGNQIVALADMPRDVDYSYTNANTLDGKFTQQHQKPGIPLRWFHTPTRRTAMPMQWSLSSSRIWCVALALTSLN
jgi:predicted phage tail protein